MIPEISAGNDWEYAIKVTKRDADSGAVVVATGIIGLTGHLATSAAGAALSSSTVNLTERASAPGEYAGTLDTAALATAVSGLADGAALYEVFTQTDGIRVARLLTYRAARVVEEVL